MISLERALGWHRLAAAALGIAMFAGAALAEEHLCKQSPKLVGACTAVRGRVLLSADAGLIMTFANERTRLSIDAPPDSDLDMPKILYDIFDDLHADVEGDFEICPVPVRVGFVDGAVCIESASNLLIKYGDSRIESRP